MLTSDSINNFLLKRTFYYKLLHSEKVNCNIKGQWKCAAQENCFMRSNIRHPSTIVAQWRRCDWKHEVTKIIQCKDLKKYSRNLFLAFISPRKRFKNAIRRCLTCMKLKACWYVNNRRSPHVQFDYSWQTFLRRN